jgi:subtilisin family serine protease
MARRLGRALLLGLMLWLTASAGRSLAAATDAQPNGPNDAQVAGAGDDAREVLVLLRAAPPHFRPNAAYGDAYDDTLGRGARHRIAARLARAHGLTLVTDWPMPLLGLDCYVMAAPAGHSAAEEAALLARDPSVAWSEPMHVYRGEGRTAPHLDTPNDPLFRAQPAAVQWRLADLYQMSTGRSVVVAVIDSQVERGHPDLLGQVEVSESFVPGPPVAGEDHGTGVAGIIAARANNGMGIAGVAPGARLMALRACWQTAAVPPATLCDTLSLAKALHFAIDHRAQVINLSLGGPPDTLLGKLIDVALARGVAVVGAYDRALPGGGFPASHPGVVAVTDTPVEAGPSGLYTAPGRDVPTTQPGGRWSLVNGSSFAAAHVSGLIALTRGGGPRERRGPILVAARSGGGAIDSCATLLRALGPCDCACARPAETPPLARR